MEENKQNEQTNINTQQEENKTVEQVNTPQPTENTISESVNTQPTENIIIEDQVKNKPNKTLLILIIVITSIVMAIAILGSLSLVVVSKKEPPETEEKLKELPLPEVTGGERGKLGIDKNINETNIDEYLNRPDAIYRDMRMLEDPAQYENIGGNRFLTGYIKGFEIVPLPYLIPISGLPAEVGNTYSGKTLFSIDETGTYTPNYAESMKLLEETFPKDKVIFLMCGGGGYAGMTKNLLVSLGWDETKIYNVGGYWYYEGKNNIKVPTTETGYDFSNVPYKEIKFNELTLNLPIYLDDKYYKSKNTEGIEKISLHEFDEEVRLHMNTAKWPEVEVKLNKKVKEYADLINNKINNKESFVVYVTSSNMCTNGVFGEVTLSSNLSKVGYEKGIYSYSLGFLIFKETKLYETVKYAPSVIIVYKGDIIAYTDANSDEDLKYSNNYEEFEKWFSTYVKYK